MIYKIIITGLVQGVGFRPFVQRTAKKLSINGNVKNTGGIVEIYTDCDFALLSKFIYDLKTTAPIGADILDITVNKTNEKNSFDDFSIVDSSENERLPIIPADIATCEKCEKELLDKNNRRFNHPFISCVDCGPRYSIIKSLPYDRCNIAMDKFPLCKNCEKEYRKESNRRMYAQTVACNDCGPKLSYTKKGNPIENAILEINMGKVIAIKDIGGYHFACLATNETAVNRLRMLKNREQKPFAVMFSNISSVKEYANVSNIEEELLTSYQRPIVLLKKKKDFPKNVCGFSNDIGAMLPSNPVQILLLKKCGPLVMTSGNITNEPIIIKDDKIFEIYNNNENLDGVLSHNRDILTPLDDSILRVICGKTQIIRRARGYTPLPLTLKINTEKQIFSSGGDLKSSFCLLTKNKAFLSQYFGDLENEDCFIKYKENIKRLADLLNIKINTFVSDMHPNYHSSNFLDDKKQIYIQHHHAHIESVIAEHGLDGEVLGFAFDGTGFGTDKTIWGGEVFKCKDGNYKRVAHLKSVKMCGGDTISKNASTVLNCYLKDAKIKLIGENKEIINSALENNINTIYSSSMGRLFDAVSAILEISNYNDYEGKCAIMLENEAKKAKTAYPLILPLNDEEFDTAFLFKQIIEAKEKNIPKQEIALGFIKSISNAVLECAKKFNIKQIALSGGVFMNRILTEMCYNKLTKNGFSVYINEKVPTNDQGISLGQAYIVAKRSEL